MKKLPANIKTKIESLAKHSQKAKLLYDEIIEWFSINGYLDEDLDGLVNDFLIDMEQQTFDAEETIRMIEDEQS
jgi:hypothetical protein